MILIYLNDASLTETSLIHMKAAFLCCIGLSACCICQLGSFIEHPMVAPLQSRVDVPLSIISHGFISVRPDRPLGQHTNLQSQTGVDLGSPTALILESHVVTVVWVSHSEQCCSGAPLRPGWDAPRAASRAHARAARLEGHDPVPKGLPLDAVGRHGAKEVRIGVLRPRATRRTEEVGRAARTVRDVGICKHKSTGSEGCACKCHLH